MGWRILQMTSACKLSVKNRQLRYEPEEGEALSLPLEDISVMMLENRNILLTGALLSELAEYNICLFSCDGSHMPNGVFTPYLAHSRYAAVASMQIASSEPLKKRLWQKIVRRKIENQAEVLKRLNHKTADKLIHIAKKVQSGDPENAEAYAAGLYWKAAFDDFKRHEEDIKNAALNYGYAVLRGCVARYAVCAGLIPSFGVHHKNQLNAYNLADDLIEPFRAFVDWIVLNLPLETEILNRETKQKLISVLTKNCSFEEEEISILNAIERTCFSLVNAFKEKDASPLSLPLFSKVPLFE